MEAVIGVCILLTTIVVLTTNNQVRREIAELGEKLDLVNQKLNRLGDSMKIDLRSRKEDRTELKERQANARDAFSKQPTGPHAEPKRADS